ncbi:co-chaperone GroES [Candidatus Aerophobetes bacterium]|uniref:Co-chaperonin GroES n=1 Tax=Aerophobetes bacterium TaxID=2030807 RepID=A0A2A4YE63_UNCAE|nr:MAG: co-chaperone GroES [Candidatus Aerophobetes bacterium]
MTQETKENIKLRPLGNRVIGKRLEQEETLKGGIILPDSAKKKQERVEILAVGKGKTNKDGSITPCPVKVGDTILMDKYASQEVTLDDNEYVIVNADEIIAVFEG